MIYSKVGMKIILNLYKENILNLQEKLYITNNNTPTS